jgi:membrane-bound serine protease (ClpP class)
MKHLFVQLMLLCSIVSFAQQAQKKVVVFDIKENIAPSASRMTNKAVNYAESINADLIIVHMNTYGGYVIDADSIRTKLLNTTIPVYVFIDNNAASAGALISLACDKIYMRPGSSIGATTVVNETGEKAPDKYQSYMRKQMRSTAESHGKDTIIRNGDTTYKYKRNPDIAEGMVDESVVVEGLDDSTKVITLTTEEAIEWGYCEGEAASIEEILSINNITNYTIERVEKSTLDKVVAFFANPALRSVLILLMIGGIYFELQSPGIGFPIAAAILAAIAYFAPLYLDGLAANWEILVFIVGLILIGLEIFVVPGFGVTGISGILLVFGSLILSMINNVNFDFSGTSELEVNNAFASLFFAMVGLVTVVILFGRSFINSRMFQKIVLADTLSESRVQTQQENTNIKDLLNQTGHAKTDIKPIGRITLNGTNFEAKTFGEFIDQGKPIIVIGIDNQYLLVKEII